MKNIFSYNTNIDKNAYMNWRTHSYDPIHNMIVVAEGFKDSALLLVKEILKDNTDKKADNLIFPVLFNANHSIEVYLKAICWTQNLLLNKSDTFDGNHNLKGLFTKVVTLENELNILEDKSVFYKELNNLESYIDELYEKIERIVKDKKGNDKIIHDITFCRYALNNDLEPQFYINTFDNVVVDLENFLTVFEQIFKTLDSLSTHYINLYDDKVEFQAGYESDCYSDY
ncbi:TPA: hypothetical protein QC443_003813 [Bacillus cereus]|uniref:HEPN domain-containing protein n=2 Tax=Bacillus TaxID=1386 RepID=A0A1Y6AMZ6_9BACI|nr:hypothetical protein [Bacillus cereus]SME45673.1 hypothetical protein BACERE00185_05032 [Bacillus mobilis]MBL3878143.1 hypothetical protein [Bacillus cereus]BCD05079.1 hypothetical protein BC30052_2134 [Bacillus cereus]HDR7981501.1 hypothetical protein [Bacillus cereus]HDR8077544.1 hypothetical protein [Bacillus cereus]